MTEPKERGVTRLELSTLNGGDLVAEDAWTVDTTGLVAIQIYDRQGDGTFVELSREDARALRDYLDKKLREDR